MLWLSSCSHRLLRWREYCSVSVCVCVYMLVCVFVCVFVSVCVWCVYVCMCAYVHVCAYVRARVCACVGVVLSRLIYPFEAE